ncbi:MAG: cytochrome c family protein [Alphaproteobacteria bacterium]|nr:cytochrome c family protein [Alphaproteobacteria bacterium]
MRMRVLIITAVAGLAGLASAAPTAVPPSTVVVKDAKGVSYTGDATAGEKTFKQCAICHSSKLGENKIGPSLFGIVGRVAGTASAYNYSAANKKSGITWTEQALFDYLENPRAKMPGTKMAYVGLRKAQDRANLIAYLKTLRPPPAAAKPK